jgi:hypothetical protein
MTFVHDLLVFLHFVGFASLFGGFFVQIRAASPVANAAMLHGALTQLVTGVLLVGLAESVDDDEYVVDNAKVAVKLVIVLIITVLVWVNRKKYPLGGDPQTPEKAAISRALLFGIGSLTLVNTAVAVFWH